MIRHTVRKERSDNIRLTIERVLKEEEKQDNPGTDGEGQQRKYETKMDERVG